MPNNNTVLHKFRYAGSDGPDPLMVQPSRDWLDEHVFSGGSDGNVLVRDSSKTDGVAWSASPSLTGLALASAGSLSWNGDTILVRDAANTLGFRNGATAQHLRVYKTFTDASNYQRLLISGDPFGAAGVGIIQQQAGTGPSSDPMYIGNQGTGAVNIRSNNQNVMTIASDGGVTTLVGGGAFQPGANVYVKTGTGIFFRSGAGAALTDGGADGRFNFVTAAFNVGVGVDVATDGTFKLRTRAHTGYSTLDCLGLKASGVAGASFGPAAVASITVVNGIVTAIS